MVAAQFETMMRNALVSARDEATRCGGFKPWSHGYWSGVITAFSIAGGAGDLSRLRAELIGELNRVAKAMS